jgi:hypothetical protein
MHSAHELMNRTTQRRRDSAQRTGLKPITSSQLSTAWPSSARNWHDAARSFSIGSQLASVVSE